MELPAHYPPEDFPRRSPLTVALGRTANALYKRFGGYQSGYAVEQSIKAKLVDLPVTDHDPVHPNELDAFKKLYEMLYANPLLSRGIPDVIFASSACIPQIAYILEHQGITLHDTQKRNVDMMRLFGKMFSRDPEESAAAIAGVDAIHRHLRLPADGPTWPEFAQFTHDLILTSDQSARERFDMPPMSPAYQEFSRRNWLRVNTALGMPEQPERSFEQSRQGVQEFFAQYAQPSDEGTAIGHALMEDFAALPQLRGHTKLGREVFRALVGPDVCDILDLGQPSRLASRAVPASYRLFDRSTPLRPVREQPWVDIAR